MASPEVDTSYDAPQAPSPVNGLGASSAAPASPAAPVVATAPTPDDGTFSRMINQESYGGHQFNPDGSVVTSPKGAIGIAQVLPSTGPEAAQYAGLPWDPVKFQTDAGYNAALGKAYYQHQLAVFGTPDKAAAAYNAGPQRLISAIQQASAKGGSYLNYLPPETQNYVQKVAGGNPGASGGSAAGGTSGAPITFGNSANPTVAPQGVAAAPAVALAQAQRVNPLQTLALMQSLAPQHQLVPVNYDPFAVQKAGTNVLPNASS